MLFSLVFLVASAVAVPLFLVRIDDDYFARPRPRRSLLFRVLRFVLGVLLVIAGVAMLVLPGQGLVTIVIGLSILEIPLRDRVMTRILIAPAVRRVIDRLRERAGKGPLALPGGYEPAFETKTLRHAALERDGADHDG